MKTITPIIIVGIMGIHSHAQDIITKDSERDPILSALLENGPELEPEDPNDSSSDPTNEDPDDSSDTAPVDAITIEQLAELAKDTGGVKVEVIGGSTTEKVNAKDIKIVAPFPAKPLSREPRGWRLTHPRSAAVLTQNVDLPNGNSITLTIRPHVIVPDANGSDVFALNEPGYDHNKGYAQTDTVGSVLADSIHELDTHSDRLNAASQRLTELLDSLPSPAPAAVVVPEPDLEGPQVDSSPEQDPE